MLEKKKPFLQAAYEVIAGRAVRVLRLTEEHSQGRNDQRLVPDCAHARRLPVSCGRLIMRVCGVQYGSIDALNVGRVIRYSNVLM